MAGTSASTPQLTKDDVYRKLLEKYKEWNLVLNAMEKEEKNLQREFLEAVDKTKIKDVMKKLNNQK